MSVNALPVIVGALCVMAIAYRYYSAFIAAKVQALNDECQPSNPAMYSEFKVNLQIDQ
jgi:carbon starvation protein CstA